MRRLARHAFTALSQLSLLLCVAVCGLWVASFTGPAGNAGKVSARPGAGTVDFGFTGAAVVRGRVVIGSVTRHSSGVWPAGRPAAAEWVCRRDDALLKFAGGLPDRAGWLGFDFASLDPRGGSSGRLAVVPCWAIAAVTAAPSVFWASLRRRRLRRGRHQAGLCPKCGYDLRAHSGGDPCPECGTPVAK